MTKTVLCSAIIWMMVVVAPVLVRASDDAPAVTLWVGYGRYGMNNFNSKLKSEGNETINGGINLGAEVGSIKCKIPKSVPFVGGQIIKLPLGIEYLDAGSKTTHTGGGGSATVEWGLPIIGVYVAPDVALDGIPWLVLRPISIGYYSLGDFLNASLTISDRSGSLELSGHSIGLKTEVVAQQSLGDRFKLFARVGYRWLEFTDIAQNPKGGIPESVGGPPIQAGSFQEDLDYSGLIGEIGLTTSF